MVVEHLVGIGRRNTAERLTDFLLELGSRLSLVGMGSKAVLLSVVAKPADRRARPERNSRQPGAAAVGRRWPGHVPRRFRHLRRL